jgi:peptide/nickel transport system ATP-binding protein
MVSAICCPMDVTIQAQILQLLKQIQQENGMALWLISHDLALVSNMADRVAVMQSGRIVEAAENKQIFIFVDASRCIRDTDLF